jgi:hypothetical protein
MSIVDRTTRLIESDTMTYPIFLADMARFAPNTVFPATVDSDCLIDFGIEVVHSVAQPEGDVVTEGAPELREGEWYQTWTVRSFTEIEVANKLARRKEELQSSAEDLRVAAFATGFPYQFGENVYHVQVRTGDRGNISDLRCIAKEVIAASGDMTFEFRVLENVEVVLTAAEMVALADRALVQVIAGYKVIWAYKKAIDLATTMEELPTPPGVFFTL